MSNISVIIRTFNEERYLDELLSAVFRQQLENDSVEVVLVDSGSTDSTLKIAEQHNCRIVHIEKETFTFGRSLNIGCAHAQGDYLVFVSGHCVPSDDNWLMNLTAPLKKGQASYVFGGQMGRDTTKFSEHRVFDKYFHPTKRTPQPDYFVNNANAALLASTWTTLKFNEEITGLEDMHLAKQLLARGERTSFVEDATVFHIHDESWQQVVWRYEREALALREIDPALHMSRRDLVRCIVSSVVHDSRVAFDLGVFLSEFAGILAFRCCQYWGSYKGSRASRQLSEATKRRYFYPTQRVG